ncbi:HPr family phosphocarrier protein [Streptomonospora wellingtoniae]|uniref:Phosphocarrier protein HPr n=1 Tax=Streptomonospora wellingtoniae TaxID=3075544 RepID=A0ABU2L073_9ACTN|nr:HPr family phosphocarrier protein [Streptomonospora sp. DSM 45055]MDT0304955.1 HPr family phosphocarrier protein [Streptomonospora sp. DSM 45055]
MHRRVTIGSPVGLHARPAALLAEAAGKHEGRIRIAKVVEGEAGTPVDAASVLGLMSLGARHGDEVELTTDDERILTELAEMLADEHEGRPAE